MIDACGSAPVLIDVLRVANTPYKGNADRNVESFFSALGAARIHAIPVTGLDRPAAFQEIIRDVIKIDDRGIAIRVPIVRLQDPQFARTLRDLIAYLGVEPGSVDLIVEYGVVGVGVPSFSYVCHRLPELQRWRTFTVLGGSFPPDLMGFKGPGQYEIPREEWTHWMNEMKRSPTQPRRPTFGDYTIQHPVYHEPVKGANPSASIRYTSDTYWVIMRGEGIRNEGGAGYAQYPANAELLCGRKEFSSAHFSAGDQYIWNIGSHKDPGPGTPETWLRAGINHHMTLVARQVPTTAAVIG
jgi:hypothetical protein